ncbi:MAG: hypothetical protein EA398_09400 [Deltaproteobacteria bacterium]|nr:MAG: hypothetical protein EA398_09400 [Deltaproteobacteria bacterium]
MDTTQQPPPSPHDSPPRPESGVSRKVLWMLPLGCVTLLVLMTAVIGGLIFFVFGAMRSSTPWVEAVEMAAEHPNVTGFTGEPLTDGLFASGSLSRSGDGGQVDLRVPVSGPRGSGAVHIVGERVAGEWRYRHAIFTSSDGGIQVDLLPAREATP